MIETDGKFYLGRDPQSKTPLLYDPDDLTTHAVVLGMTGSGKTSLCIDLLEEAALNNIPALMIDPKGDITNALLHFPDLLPDDFQPWVNPDEARREGKTIQEMAAEEASKWSKGLADWEIDKERIQALKNAAHFAIYTPGSDAGIPISILASLKAPGLPWEGNEEPLREKISGTVTAILGLVGMEDIDPVQSREHILLANIFERAWSAGKDLDLGELILQTQNPPFDKLGVFDLNTFFSEKDRFALAMTLNNILASPSFQPWVIGTEFDIGQLLYGPDKKPRHSIFYIAHLNDSERMFFVTLLYSAIDTWMRQQKGSTSLRALLYFDELYGFVPPIKNPPSKHYILKFFKMARAFGFGQILATQNPVDIDYKGLSNAGTWFIGKLQTQQDKDRLLDGLSGASTDFKREEFDKLISSLGKREFILHNVHESKPSVFMTRWAMNYLAGPLTREQIPQLNDLANAELLPSQPQAEEKASVPSSPAAPGSATRPAVPTGVAEYFLPNNLTLMEAFKADGQPLPEEAMSQGLLYKPVLLAQADVRYLDRKYNLDYEQKYCVIAGDIDRRGIVRWEDLPAEPVDDRNLDRQASPDAKFGVLEGALADGKLIKGMETDFVDYIYRSSEVKVFGNAALKQYAGPPATEGEFRKMLSEAARKERDAETKAIETKYKTRVEAIQKKLNREKRELSEDEQELSQRKLEELGTHAENVLSLFGGSRRRVSTSLSKHRMTSQAKADVEESIDAIAELEAELADLAKEIEDALDEVEEKWSSAAGEVEEIAVNPLKKDILLELFGVAWMPYHVVDVGGQAIELPGFKVG